MIIRKILLGLVNVSESRMVTDRQNPMLQFFVSRKMTRRSYERYS